AADEGVADGDLKQVAQGADFVPFLDSQELTENNDADVVFFEVEGDAADAGAGELEHLAGHHASQAVDAGDAVAHFQDAAHFAHVQPGAELLNLRLQN